MPPPKSQLRRLDQDLRVHEERLEFLRDQIARLSDEPAARERISGFGRDGRVLDALGASMRARRRCKGVDAGGFLLSRDVELPAGARADWDGSDERPAPSVRLSIGEWEFFCVWDAAEGFSVKQHQTPLPDQAERSAAHRRARPFPSGPALAQSTVGVVWMCKQATAQHELIRANTRGEEWPSPTWGLIRASAQAKRYGGLTPTAAAIWDSSMPERMFSLRIAS
jgi:hypothetical protein